MILALGAHPDDCEYAAGGTLHKMHEDEVIYVAMSPCIESNGGSDLWGELVLATDMLCINHHEMWDYPVRDFGSHRQRILDKLILMRDTYNPSLVITHDPDDWHQDHAVVGQEALRAFRCSILAFRLPWNGPSTGTYYSVLSQENVDAKVQAVLSYKSQSHRQYMSQEAVESMARTEGLGCGQEFAERFRVMRWVDG